MSELDPNSIRYQVLESAKKFKSSWIELGQHLFSVQRDRLYKDWGYLTFEAYCSKEISIRQATAVKLLKSYFFLEREEPAFLKRQTSEERKPSQIPSYESVNALRLVKENRKLPESDYQKIREDVLDHVKEDSEVKKKIRYILKNRIPSDLAEDKEDRKISLAKRLATSLKNAKNEMRTLSFPAAVLKKTDELIELLSKLG